MPEKNPNDVPVKDVQISVLLIALEEACKDTPHDEKHYVDIAKAKAMENWAKKDIKK